jgi:hypothetical protein
MRILTANPARADGATKYSAARAAAWAWRDRESATGFTANPDGW